MKEKRFRYKLTALFIIFLIGLSILYGFQTIPVIGSDDALRHSILRLTGQETPIPVLSNEALPSSQILTEGLGTLITPDLLPLSTDPPLIISNTPSASQEAVSSPQASPQILPSLSSTDTPFSPLSEALSDYFKQFPQ